MSIETVSRQKYTHHTNATVHSSEAAFTPDPLPIFYYPLTFPLACARPCNQPTVLYFFPFERDIDPRFGASSSVALGCRPSKSVELTWDWEM